ncbi:hypothetical protein MHYP_G00017270 [Metynnis hypsauchen]
MQTDPDDDDPCHEHDYCVSTEPAALDLSLNDNEELREERSRLRKQIEDLTVSSKFCLERFSASDDDIRFFTRFASHAHLMGFWKQIEPATHNIIRVTRARTVEKTDQVPHCSSAKSEVFSTYKSHCTFKGLIGIAPHGAVTFVSSLYQGAISDKEILKQSGIVALLAPSMAIMVDKGFFVEDCVPCKVHIPTFLSKRAQLSRSEIRTTQSIARLRVHVERVIRRVKEHKIFSTVIPLSITGSINQIFTVACLLVNYQNGPLVKAWANNG